MTDHDLPDDLLARVLSGEASAADRVAVETWAAADPAHRIILDRLLAATSPPKGSSWDVDRAWKQTVEVISEPDKPVMIAATRPSRLQPVLLKLAAAVVVVLGLVFAWRQIDRTPLPSAYATGQGERLEVPLPDGTLAVLGPRSSLVVPPNFGADSRRVTLRGEGWFQASHDGAAFEVETGEYLVRDIGTVFTVTARHDDALRVMVVEGEVEVRTVADTAALLASLHAGDLGDFVRPAAGLEAEAVIAREQPVAALAAWHTGTLELIDAPVQSVLDRLGAWHGVEIGIAPALATGRTITATLPLDSLDAALEIVAPLLGAQVVRGPDGVRLQ